MRKSILKSATVAMLMFSMMVIQPVNAAEVLKAENFIEIYPMGGMEIEVSDDAAGARLKFKKIDSRVTLCGPSEEEMWGRILPLDTMVIKMSGISYSMPTSQTNGKTIAFTFSKEAGSFYATGATGIHIRLFSTKDGCFIYAKKADAPDEGEDVYIPYSPVEGWLRIPENLTCKIYKVGDEYKIELNEKSWRIPASKVEENVSRSGKVFVNIGVMGVNNFTLDMIVNEIYNDPSLKEIASSSEVSSAPSSSAPSSSASVSSTPQSSIKESSVDVSSEEQVSSDELSDDMSGDVSDISSDDSDTSTDESSVSEDDGKLTGDPNIVKIDNGTMTMNVKLGTSYAQLFGALTITGGYEIEFLNPDDRVVLDETGKLENDSKVRIVSGDEVLATFTVVVLSNEEFDKLGEESEEKQGLPGFVIALIVIASLGVLAGGGFAGYKVVNDRKLKAQDSNEDKSDF